MLATIGFSVIGTIILGLVAIGLVYLMALAGGGQRVRVSGRRPGGRARSGRTAGTDGRR